MTFSKNFNTFEQESAKTAQKYGGTGLGLSITKNLVSMMKGSIEVRSKQNEGTTFTVTLGFERTAQPEHISDKATSFSHIRVLVVDDEKSSCEYIKALLKRCGVKSDTVTSGEAAIKQIMRRIGTDYFYDMVIMDWNMPDMNGVETTRRIRTECKSDIPVIIATAFDITEFEEEAMKAGVTRIISKPLFQSSMFDLLVTMYGECIPVSQIKSAPVHLNVLLAEDNEMNREIAIEILENADIQVDAVCDGKQAFDQFVNSPAGTYQAILMDIQMPIMDGYQATSAIRSSSHSEARTIPIIAMTSNAFNEDIAQAIACGMNEHVTKPIDYDKLFSVLGKYKKEIISKENGTHE